MVAFTKMWDDVCGLLTDEKLENMNIVETFKTGFVVKSDNETQFVTKDDFIDVWCKMLYFNEISKTQIDKEHKTKQKYVYQVIKQLPYICENCDTLRIVE